MHQGPPDFTGINNLAHLEELLVVDVTAFTGLFGSFANKNVRSVWLILGGVGNVSKLKEFVQKSVKLKNFKVC